MTSYGVIYCDPPWRFNVYSDKGKGRSAESWYDTMTLDDIKALPVAGFATPDCVLFMWVTDPMLRHAFSVLDAWGFTYKTVGFYWIKMDFQEGPHGNQPGPPFMGTGYWTRANPEQCLLATRGNPKRLNADVRKLVIAPRREHSRKPDEIYTRIERLCAGPYLELFARSTRPGWDTLVSNEIEFGIPTTRRWRSNSGPCPTSSDLPI